MAGLLEGRIGALFVETRADTIENFVAGARLRTGSTAAGAVSDVVFVPVALRIAFLEGHPSVQV
jgi:hypothetical protein